MEQLKRRQQTSRLSINLTSLLTWVGWGYPSTVCSSPFLLRVNFRSKVSLHQENTLCLNGQSTPDKRETEK